MPESSGRSVQLAHLAARNRLWPANPMRRVACVITKSAIVAISTIVLVAACGGSSGLADLVGEQVPQLHNEFEEYTWDQQADDQFNSDTATKLLRVEDFTRGLLPFIEYRHLDTRFESDDDMAIALQTWARDNVYIDERNVSEYLYTLMNIILLPPPSFESALATVYTDDSIASDIESKLLPYYIDLANEWLSATQDRRPAWLQIEP